MFSRPTTMSRLTMSHLLGGIGTDLPGMGEDRSRENLIGPVKRDDVVLQHQGEQVVLIFRIQLARVLTEQGWHVQRRDDLDLADLHRLARSRVLAIAAALGGQINDNGAGLHARDLLVTYQL